MISNRWKYGTFLIALLTTLSCTDNGTQSVEADSVAVSPVTETSKIFGNHEIHFNAFKSTFLLPEVAKLYGIGRDKKLGVVMVSVIRKDAPGVGVDARVSGAATNLASQMKNLKFDEIREGEAIYHISTFAFNQKEHLTFNVDVEIAPTGETHALKWRQEFWTD